MLLFNLVFAREGFIEPELVWIVKGDNLPKFWWFAHHKRTALPPLCCCLSSSAFPSCSRFSPSSDFSSASERYFGYNSFTCDACFVFVKKNHLILMLSTAGCQTKNLDFFLHMLENQLRVRHPETSR